MSGKRTMNSVIHAALRRDLRRLDDALGAFEDGSKERAAQLVTAWANYSGQLHKHHADEEDIFWPALKELGFDQTLQAELETEHQRMVEALNAADSAMNSFSATPSAANAIAARAALGALSEPLLSHLEHEERDLEPFAAERLKTPPLKLAQKKVRKKNGAQGAAFLAWLIDGADADTLQLLRSEVPPPVLFLVPRMGSGRVYRQTVASVWT